MYSPLKIHSSVVQLVHVGWKIIECDVDHATSYVLEIICCYQCTQRCRWLYSPPPMYSPPNVFVQLVHVGWKIIEYTVVHATSYVLNMFRYYQYTQRSRLLYFPPLMYSLLNMLVQLVHVGWKIIEYTFVYATPYEL